MSAIIIIIYVVAGIIPAIFLMHYIYKYDKLEKEPWPLLRSLIIGGCLAALLAMVLEEAANYVINSMSYSSETSYYITEATMVALVEEAAKMFFLYRKTWRSPQFNFRYDGIVYAVFVSLGFAALENVLYIFAFGLSIAVSRALLAVPAHMAFGVFMGSFYGRAKAFHIYGKDNLCRNSLILAYVVPVALHAFYDSCAMIGSDMAMMLFVAFVVIMYIVVFRKVKMESRTDMEI